MGRFLKQELASWLVELATKELPCTRTARCDQLHDKVPFLSENRKRASDILCSEHNKKY